jgi:hypothetical protein
MKTYILCPVSDKKIDEKVARVNAAITFALIAMFVLTGSIIPVVFLAIDFLLRSSILSNYSPVAMSSRAIVRVLGIEKSYINAGTKIFAARLGLLMACFVILLFALNLVIPAFILAGMLGLLTFLEAAFGLCIACEIYPYVYKFLYRSAG